MNAARALEAIAAGFAAIANAMAAICEVVTNIGLPVLVRFARALRPTAKGLWRCYGPTPLAIDGHAYRRRTRRRRS